MKPILTAGAISWSELHTTDAEAASEFYKSIFKWSLESMMMGSGKYIVANSGTTMMAGIMNKEKKEMPPTWMFYVTVKNTDATMKKAKSLGATVMDDSIDVPGVGRMGTFKDPQGAILSVMQYEEPEHEAHQHEFEDNFVNHGGISWFELRVPDPESAVKFYKSLFGWEVQVMDMSMGPYHTVSLEGTQFGAIFRVPAEQMPPHWGAYVTVDDADLFASSVSQHGGKVMYGPAEIPTVGRFVMFSDPQGAVLMGIEYQMPAE